MLNKVKSVYTNSTSVTLAKMSQVLLSTQMQWFLHLGVYPQSQVVHLQPLHLVGTGTFLPSLANLHQLLPVIRELHFVDLFHHLLQLEELDLHLLHLPLVVTQLPHHLPPVLLWVEEEHLHLLLPLHLLHLLLLSLVPTAAARSVLLQLQEVAEELYWTRYDWAPS